MNNSTSYINDVNTKAVQLLQESRYKEAISCLRGGVKIVLAHVAEINSTDRPLLVPFTFEAQQESMQAHRSSLQCLNSSNIEGDEGLTYTVAIPEVHDDMSISPGNVFVVYNRAFTYYKHGVFNKFADYSKAAATLLFNMGIAFHHQGIQETNTAALKKSLDTYQMAYRVLLSQDCDDSFSYLIMLALCNNMNHIHGHFFNLKAAKSLCEVITEVLASIPLEDSSAAVDDYAFFVSEAALFEGREMELACAPAA
jgi:hypothetical protein